MKIMDNPGASLFRGIEININNSQNDEEDLEDELKRQEELKNLLAENLDNFKYDSSTNSSMNGTNLSDDEVQEKYRESSASEQLKILYDVRMRELNHLQEEYENYKKDKTNEVKTLKNKLLNFEADIKQLQISLNNSQDLLVEKNDIINSLNKTLQDKENQIKKQQQNNQQLEIEICAYKTTVNELNFKLQAENQPFNLGARIFKSNEMQNVHQDQMLRLEALLEEQTKKAQMFERENLSLHDDLDSLIKDKNENEIEYKTTVNSLMNSFESAQQQCKDLVDVVASVGKENEHFKERMKNYENNNGTVVIDKDSVKNSLDVEVLLTQMEKLKRMLLDKSVEINTLQSKLKNYEVNLAELFEYRKLKVDVHNLNFNTSDSNTLTNLLVMQNELHNYTRMLDDKDQQISNLTLINRELQEKIEEMLLQTRHDIQNLSHKYSLPQLEIMSEELKNAEEKIQQLETQLAQSPKDKTKQLEQAQQQIVTLQKIAEKEKVNFEEIVKMIQKDLDKSESEREKLKQLNEELTAKHNLDGKSIKSEYEELKSQLGQVMDHLQKAKPKQDLTVLENVLKEIDEVLLGLKQTKPEELPLEQKLTNWRAKLALIDNLPIDQKLVQLQETIDELNHTKTMAEGDKCTIQFQLQDTENQLELARKQISLLEHHVKTLRADNEKKAGVIKEIKENFNELEQLRKNLKQLENDISGKISTIKMCEEEKEELNKLMQQLKLQLDDAKDEVLKLRREIGEINEKAVRKNLEKELKEAENQLEQSRIEEGLETPDNDLFKNSLQTAILNAELTIRDELQTEYTKKLNEIEKKYREMCMENTNLYKHQVEKTKNLEKQYRGQLGEILGQCAQKITEIERENEGLTTRIQMIKAEYDEFKQRALENEEKYMKLLAQIQSDTEKKERVWKVWSKEFVSKSLTIEDRNKRAKDKVLTLIKKSDLEVTAIEKQYKDKMRKYIKHEIM